LAGWLAWLAARFRLMPKWLLIAQPWAAFGEGTDKGDTRAKPEIWKERAKFDEYADKMQAEMVKLSAAAKTGNLDSIKTAVNATGGSCKTCHDAYRKE
jgi:cytochrome c556